MRIPEPFTIRWREDRKTFLFSINKTSGLPKRVCDEWQRRSFSQFPDELIQYRSAKYSPTAKGDVPAAAKTAVQALIAHLKAKQAEGSARQIKTEDITVGEWIEKFIQMETSPRTGINNSKNKPPSVSTFTGYKKFYVNHIKDDPICKLKMSEIEEQDILEYHTRLAVKKVYKKDYLVGGTKTFAATVSFVRTAFNMFQRSNKKWINPYVGIEKVSYKSTPRDALEEEEMLRLFGPGVLSSVIELAVCACMFLAGLRRAEVFSLKPEDLDWKTPSIKVRRAWQNFDYKNRVMGPPKGKKERKAPFDPVLQAAIKKLWEENGQHEFVFTIKGRTTRKGKIIPAKPPGPSWVKGRFKIWIERAGIELNGRDIVPHSARHTLATLLADRGESIKHIQELLGHSDWKTTSNYIHVTGKAIRGIGEKIEEVSKEINQIQETPSNVIEFKVS